MDGEDLVTITVEIAGRTFPLKVKQEDEPSIREIVKGVNDKFKHFQRTYKSKGKLDCLCMTALTYAVEFQKLQHSTNQNALVNSKLAHLEDFFDQALASL